MKRKYLVLIVLVFSSLYISSYAKNRECNNDSIVMDCTGHFSSNGKDYTITLHDVSLWTCIKFKVGSWFQ